MQRIFIAGATRDPDGTLEASRVTVGKDDIAPARSNFLSASQRLFAKKNSNFEWPDL
jgi:hypothetical protein